MSGSRDSPKHCDPNGAGASHCECSQPAGPSIAAGSKRVHECDRPRCIGKPVDCPPHLQTDPRAQQARRDQREKKVEGNGAQSEPYRSIRREKRYYRILIADGREVIDHRSYDVDDDEGEAEQRDVSVEAQDEEARRSRGMPARRAHHAEKDTGAQKHERHDTRSARDVPQQLSIAARRSERQQSSRHDPPDTATGCAGAGVGGCAGVGEDVEPGLIAPSGGGAGTACRDR